MNLHVKIFVLIISLALTACASSTMSNAPDKYALGDQLQPVNMIRNPWITDWEEADNQSLFIRTAPNGYYLLILKTPCLELHFQEGIALSYDNDMIMAGFSSVIVSVGANIKNRYLIDRIFKVNGPEQMRSIRSQLKE